MALAYVEADACEWVAVLEPHEDDIAGLSAIRVGEGEETSASTCGIEDLDLIFCHFLDWVWTKLDCGARWWNHSDLLEPDLEAYNTISNQSW